MSSVIQGKEGKLIKQRYDFRLNNGTDVVVNFTYILRKAHTGVHHGAIKDVIT
jgi:hypothetical protein